MQEVLGWEAVGNGAGGPFGLEPPPHHRISPLPPPHAHPPQLPASMPGAAHLPQAVGPSGEMVVEGLRLRPGLAMSQVRGGAQAPGPCCMEAAGGWPVFHLNGHAFLSDGAMTMVHERSRATK